MVNFYMDNLFDYRDFFYYTYNMRLVVSVGVLQYFNVFFQEYYNQGRNDLRGNDYENYFSVDFRIFRN